jgi:pyruvate-ferredoxin/flavodoxin oxidoreductase
MIKASASGCAVVWGGFYPSNPYTTVKETGRGVPYGHSLFEDNAEYGYGVLKAYHSRRRTLAS